jgi:hypothetical protein
MWENIFMVSIKEVLEENRKYFLVRCSKIYEQALLLESFQLSSLWPFGVCSMQVKLNMMQWWNVTERGKTAICT